jgi:hypothetical protein
MCKTWVGSRRVTSYQIDLNLWLLSKPLAQFNVIELKVLWDALCDSYYDVEVNCKIGLFEGVHEYKPVIAR